MPPPRAQIAPQGAHARDIVALQRLQSEHEHERNAAGREQVADIEAIHRDGWKAYTARPVSVITRKSSVRVSPRSTVAE